MSPLFWKEETLAFSGPLCSWMQLLPGTSGRDSPFFIVGQNQNRAVMAPRLTGTVWGFGPALRR